MAKHKPAARAPRAALRAFYLERTETVRIRVTYMAVAATADEALAAAAAGDAKYVSKEELGTESVSDFSVSKD